MGFWQVMKMVNRGPPRFSFCNLGETRFILVPNSRFSPSLWGKSQLQGLEATGQRHPEWRRETEWMTLLRSAQLAFPTVQGPKPGNSIVHFQARSLPINGSNSDKVSMETPWDKVKISHWYSLLSWFWVVPVRTNHHGSCQGLRRDTMRSTVDF